MIYQKLQRQENNLRNEIQKILFPKLNLNNGHKSKDIETYRSEYVILKTY